ncbi:hypothetical protein AM1BK_40060 [Neobacillus kokaensis]|uniref:Uncharacterized protein n=1 Tax=Neobacillus kokaensis TaxID=2759023 RepID=A0ABQ3N6A6_9BACI|nr:hypothetical protein AM1BK_40060 [Neobacillus kokaensis]
MAVFAAVALAFVAVASVAVDASAVVAVAAALASVSVALAALAVLALVSALFSQFEFLKRMENIIQRKKVLPACTCAAGGTSLL